MAKLKDGWYCATHIKSNTKTTIRIESGVAYSDHGMGDAINETFKDLKPTKP